MEVTFDITKFYSLKINSDIILVKPHKTSQGKRIDKPQGEIPMRLNFRCIRLIYIKDD